MADILLGRGWKTEINTTGSTFVEIKGVNEHSLSFDSADADITTKESGAWSEHIIARRSMEISLKGFRLEDENGVRDPGQVAVEAAAVLTDYASLKNFKTTSPGGEVREYAGTVSLDDLGGSIDEGQSWGCTIKQSGPVTVTEP